MTKAEELAEAYEKSLDYYHCMNDWPSIAYRAGYEQAEKDLALTWEDIGTIAHLIYVVNQEFHTRYDQDETGEFDFSRQDVYEEVLKRFMEEQK